MSSFKNFLQKGNGLATSSTSDLLNEISRRERCLTFPLHVFNNKIKGFLEALCKSYDLPPSYVGLSLLSAYSTAIGTAYKVETGTRDFIFLPVWACLVGISSSGSTTALSKIYEPLQKIQNEFDKHWHHKTDALKLEDLKKEKLQTVITRDSHMPTLFRFVLPDNPKGICKMHDELSEWINGMNQLSTKEGIDEQVWISSWNCVNYSGIRSNKQKFVVQKPFLNVIGKLQYALLPKLFTKDRGTTGFAYRMLFALPEIDKIATREINFEMSPQLLDLHNLSLVRLYKDLPVDDPEADSKICKLSPEAINILSAWRTKKITAINRIANKTEMNCQAGIYGKISEYAYRFAAILHLADRTFDVGYIHNVSFQKIEWISGDTMTRSLELTDYFYNSAIEVYEIVQKDLVAPSAVLATAYMFKKGKSASDIGEMLYGGREPKHKVRAQRQIKAWIVQYPRIFGANTN